MILLPDLFSPDTTLWNRYRKKLNKFPTYRNQADEYTCNFCTTPYSNKNNRANMTFSKVPNYSYLTKQLHHVTKKFSMHRHTKITLPPYGCSTRIVCHMKVELNEVPLGNKSSFKVSWRTTNLNFLATNLENLMTDDYTMGNITKIAHDMLIRANSLCFP